MCRGLGSDGTCGCGECCRGSELRRGRLPSAVHLQLFRSTSDSLCCASDSSLAVLMLCCAMVLLSCYVVMFYFVCLFFLLYYILFLMQCGAMLGSGSKRALFMFLVYHS